VVEDGNLITSRKPDDVPAFSEAIIRALSRVQVS
jgi:protease I